jgi:tetratricopeptide (TPR) repeat protein
MVLREYLPLRVWLQALRLIIAGSIYLFGGALNAQTHSLIGGSGFANECYQNSQRATQTLGVARQNLEPCDRAINDAALPQSDLVASLVNRGIIYAALQDYVAAAKDYNRAIQLDDEVGEAYINRGNLWFLAQRFEDAIVDYDFALKFGVVNMHVAHLNRGMALEQLGQKDAAKASYQQALEIIPEWPPAQMRITRLKTP